MSQNKYWNRIETPLGAMIVVWYQGTIITVGFEGAANLLNYGDARKEQCPDQLSRAFEKYFEGYANAFDRLLIKQNGPSFSEKVWKEVRKIPFGETRAYSDIAIAVGSPKAVRAVGTANARNPHTIIVPCHRVIGKNGSLTGYGGGLKRKAWLLEHEGVEVPAT